VAVQAQADQVVDGLVDGAVDRRVAGGELAGHGEPLSTGLVVPAFAAQQLVAGPADVRRVATGDDRVP